MRLSEKANGREKKIYLFIFKKMVIWEIKEIIKKSGLKIQISLPFIVRVEREREKERYIFYFKRIKSIEGF